MLACLLLPTFEVSGTTDIGVMFQSSWQARIQWKHQFITLDLSCFYVYPDGCGSEETFWSTDVSVCQNDIRFPTERDKQCKTNLVLSHVQIFFSFFTKLSNPFFRHFCLFFVYRFRWFVLFVFFLFFFLVLPTFELLKNLYLRLFLFYLTRS